MDYCENLQSVLDFIDQNIKTNINVKKLSEISSYSIPHLYKIFKQYVGCSPMEYLKKRRLYLAAKKLITGNYKVIRSCSGDTLFFRTGQPHIYENDGKERKISDNRRLPRRVCII